MPLQKKLIEHLLKTHPKVLGPLGLERLQELVSPQLLSPFQIDLPKHLLTEAQEFVAASYKLRENPQYQNFLQPDLEARGISDPGNKSILMSYDFHVDCENHLKLIEINTNASFLAMACEMYQMREIPNPVARFQFSDLKSCIETEMKLQKKQIRENFKVAIIDEDPEKQRLYIEFLVYQSHFQNWDWETEIADYRKVFKADFIYNRFTDFYLSGEQSLYLRKDFLAKEICFSPNPFEYLLLADKQRMIDWNSDVLWNQVSDQGDTRPIFQRNLPLAMDLSPEKADQIWGERKKFFFKPKRAYGAKQSFRGGSISRKAFDEILTQDFIAQEFIPAPERKFQTPDGEQNFKFDLRFYAYQDQLQTVVARLYQGQVTNLRTPFGGFAPVVFTN